jgi:hypothetical protein
MIKIDYWNSYVAVLKHEIISDWYYIDKGLIHFHDETTMIDSFFFKNWLI